MDKKVRAVEGGGWMLFCPACGNGHLFDERWTFNGDNDKPTFTPSMLCRRTEGDPPVTHENFEEYKRNPWPQTQISKVCHSFVTDGNWIYLSDCTHKLAGQTVPVEAF